MYSGEGYWPEKCTQTTMQTKGLELKGETINFVIIKEKSTPLKKLCTRYSSWFNLVKGVAWLRKCLQWLKNKESVETKLSVAEVHDSKHAIIRAVQYEEYASKRRHLEKGDLPKSNRLYDLEPYLDEARVIRSRGRLKNSSLNFGKQQPMLLPSSHKITELFVKDAHET